MMELDVHITRKSDEYWGFRLIGGVDFGMPLTVIKVLPGSPADRAGLQNGDTVLRINDTVACDLSHDESRKAVAVAADSLTLGVTRGLYDPVLDDHEPIFLDPEDFDQPSRPTEVPFGLSEFTDIPTLNGYPEFHDTPKLSESRSLTASPFILSTKPYRPFSTEPLPPTEVPPIEDPIILNPDYSDVFGKLGIDEDFLPKTRFKLPISEQHDPDGTKQKGVTKTTESVQSKEVVKEKRKEEVKFMEEMKKDIDLEKIELTATSIVDESLLKAVTVAEEIKKEMDVALLQSSVVSSETESKTVKDFTSTDLVESSMKKESLDIKSEKLDTIVQKEMSKSSKESVNEVSQLVELLDKTTEELIQKSDVKVAVSVAKEVEKFETIDRKQESVEERKQSTRQEIEETIVAGSVKSKSLAFDEKKIEDERVQSRKSIEETKVKDVNSQKSAKTETAESSQKTAQSKTSDTKMSTSRLLAEQRAYIIGLQTIPNIRGTAHSSYHYDLLLRTFFIHLTDVMVALSRFILAEPLIKPTEESEVKKDIVTEQKVTETVSTEKEEKTYQKATEEVKTRVNQEKHDTEFVERKKEAAVVDAVVEEKREDMRGQRHVERYYAQEDMSEEHAEGEIIEKRYLSGAEMSQLSEKKSEQLTQIMDAVISEFETKAGIEESEEKLAIRERRSRSRSRVQDETSNDPNWMSKVEARKTIGEYTEGKTTTAISSMESTETKKVESRHETRDTKSSKEGKMHYIAICESHVYTNKDAILEEQMSETSSVQSTEETKLAMESVEAISTEKVAVESSQIQEAVREKIDLSTVNATEAMKIVEQKQSQEVKSEQTAVKTIETEFKKVEEKQEKAVQEVIPAVEIKEVKPVIKDEPKTITIAESVEVVSEAKSVAIKEEAVAIKQDLAVEKAVQREEIVAVKEESIVKQESLTTKEETSKEEIFVKKESFSTETVSESKSEEIKEDKFSLKDAVEIMEDYFVKEKAKVDIEMIAAKEAVAIKEESSVKQTIAETTEEIKSEEIKSVATKEAISIVEDIVSMKEESLAIKEDTLAIKEEQIAKEVTVKQQDESTELKVTKEKVLEDKSSVEIVEISESESKAYQFESETECKIDESYEESFTAKIDTKVAETFESTTEVASEVKESTFVAKSTESHYNRDNLKLALQKDYVEEKKIESPKSVGSDTDIKTPTPSTVPPTPLTDEYMFKLEIPLPKTTTTVPRDCSLTPEDEDPHIVKKSLVPNIETKVEEGITYDPPLPTPPGSKPTSPGSKPTSPVYTKPGLKGGADRREPRKKKEEILEIERKSSLLASAIDQTIKSIEEYKEEVGIETKKQTTNIEKTTPETNGVIYNGYAKIIETKVFNTEKIEDHKMDIETTKVDAQITNNIVENGLPETVETSFTAQDTNLSKNVEEVVENKIVAEVSKNIEPEVLKEDTEKQFVQPLINDVTVPIVESVIKPECKAEEVEKRDPMEGYRPVQFNVDEIQHMHRNLRSVYISSNGEVKEKKEMYKTETGEVLGTHQGIVDGLEEAVVDDEVAKELGKPGMSEDKIAELISGESEMLREAHVMGLSRVITSHMHRANDDDSSVDFNKIKPVLESLKDSEVLKALNEELKKTREETKKKEERKWTTFLQKPERPVPKGKAGYQGYAEPEQSIQELYKVKIVKQPKPKVAPDYKPENFETGLLPWEERALREPTPPPVEPEDPILVPEDPPEVFEAVDPLPESEVPDLEDSGIPLPPPELIEEQQPLIEEPEEEEGIELDLEAVVEETEKIVAENLVEEMDQSKIADQLMMSVQNMVDPNAPLEQQLAQMRAQLAALAQLPCVIQQSLELVTKQLSHLSQMEASQTMSHSETTTDMKEETSEEVTQNHCPAMEEATEDAVTEVKQQNGLEEEQKGMEEQRVAEQQREVKPTATAEELQRMKKEEEEMMEEQRRVEKQKKELMDQLRIEQESKQVKQHPTPRVGKPKPLFGPATPQARPLVLPGGRKWRKPADAYNEQFITETLAAQAELIQGKTKGCSYESVLLPYDERINFLKYEKPPVSLDHLQNSDVYKLVHNMEQAPAKRVEMRTPVICEADYREKCRSVTPCMDIPQQVRP